MIPSMKSLFSRHAKKVIMGLLFIAFTSVFCYTAYAASTKSVTIDANGHQIKDSTHLTTVSEVLKESGIKTQQHDVVTPSLGTTVKDGMTIKWLPAVQIQVDHKGQSQSVWTTAKTVGDFLSQEGMKISAHDAVSPSPDTPLTKNMVIQVKKGIQVTLDVGGKAHQIWTTPKTVKDLLANQNITLGSKDKVSPSLVTKVSEGAKILVTRVTTKNKVEKTSVDYKVINRTNAHLTKGQTHVIRQGKKGVEEKTYKVTYENGKEVKRDLIKTSVVQAPISKIVEHGTKVVHYNFSTSRSLDNSGQTAEMVSTAYTAHCRGCSGVTKTGINLINHPNAKVVAVDPSVIPLGTKLYVQGYGYAVAADTGSAIKGNRIDLFFSSTWEADQWGYKRVKVRILN